MILLSLLLMQAAPDAALIDQYRARTRAEIPCKTTSAPQEILVCGQREADKKYRVSFVTTDPRDSVPTERNQLLHNPMPKCGVTGPFFLESCGMVGVSVSSNGQSPVRFKTRQLAP